MRVSVKHPKSDVMGDQVTTTTVGKPLWLTVPDQDKNHRTSQSSAITTISNDERSRQQNRRRREKHQAEEQEAFETLIFMTALGANGFTEKANDATSGGGGVGDVE